MEFNKILHGDSKVVLLNFPDNCVDIVVTDPSYGLSITNKKWEVVVPEVEAWKQAYRVLKPGAFLFATCTPRQDFLTKVIGGIQEAGFDISFTSINYVFATGFPKAMNMAKAIDKRLGVKSTVVGTRTAHDIRGNAMMAARDPELTKAVPTIIIDVTVPTSTEGKTFNGAYAGFQPKPAYETVIVAMKPLSEDNYVDQALANGKGVTWLGECRIPHDEEVKITDRQPMSGDGSTFNNKTCGFVKGGMSLASASPEGRFPANLLVSDDALNDGRVTKSNKSDIDSTGSGGIWKESSGHPAGPTYTDSGSYSRYFDLDKWFGKKFNQLPEEVRCVFPFLIVTKPSKSERNKGCESLPLEVAGGMRARTDGSLDGRVAYNRNTHPTVKPIKLGSYLITLGSRPGDVVLDLFCGSGSFCIAAKMLGRKYIGIDSDVKSVEIATARINSW